MPLAPYTAFSAAGLAPVAAAMARAGYDQTAREGMERVLEQRGHMDLEAAKAYTAADSPVNTLLRLFALALPVPVAAATAVLGEGPLHTLLSLGVLSREGDALRAEVSIIPAAGFYTTRDFAAALTGRALPVDHVLGIGPASMALARLTVRRRAALTLDLGVGQGFQSLLASGHSGRVIGTDVNARALSCTALSAGLSGKTNIEPCLGSFFEPVERHRGEFDLIVSNPPFVIAPPTDVVAFSSGGDGDACVEHIARTGPAFLAPGGFLCMFCNWHHPTAEDWAQRPASWVQGTGCDAWLVRLERYTPRLYAERWTRELNDNGHGVDGVSHAAQVDRWVRHFEHLGIGGVTLGLIALRRREGRNWARGDVLSFEYLTGEGGDQIERLFRNETANRELTDDALANLVLVPAPTTEVDQRSRFVPGGGPGGGLVAQKTTLRQVVGFPMAMGLEGSLLDFLGRFDGKLTVREMVGVAAKAAGADAGSILPRVMPVVRRLLETTHLQIVG